MTWEKLYGLAAYIGIEASGRIVWNDAAHTMMQRPHLIELFHDAEEGHLGFRRLNNCEDDSGLTVFEVLHEDTGVTVFAVEAFRHLSNAGVSVDELYVADLNEPEPPIVNGDPGEVGLFWIDLP